MTKARLIVDLADDGCGLGGFTVPRKTSPPPIVRDMKAGRSARPAARRRSWKADA